MLSENIRTLRKQKGYSQETLAERLHIVRQTVSKWEKGISVPDAELLQALADVLEVSVSDLLGEKIQIDEDSSRESEVAKQLAILNDQLASQSVRRKKIIRRSAIGVAAAIFVIVAVYIFCFWAFRVQPRQNAALTTTALECRLNDETYYYEITYDEQYEIYETGGDEWIADHVQTEQYDDANVLIAQIEDYFAARGGTCTVTEVRGVAEPTASLNENKTETAIILEEPPALSVVSDNAFASALLGAYSWQKTNADGTTTEMKADSAHPLDCEDLLLPFETTETTATLNFTEDPAAILSVKCWSDEYWGEPTANSEAVTINGNVLTLKPGGYIYEITAEWNTGNGYGGTASYSIYLKMIEES